MVIRTGTYTHNEITYTTKFRNKFVIHCLHQHHNTTNLEAIHTKKFHLQLCMLTEKK